MYENVKEIEKKFEMKEFPLNVIVEVGNHCNLNCTTCINDKLTRKKGFMDIFLYKKIIDEIADNNVYCRVWLDFYGEPLLVKYKLYYMIDYAKKKGLKNININTNGTLINKEMAEMLLDSGIDFISIDVDGFSKEVYEKIRIGADRDVLYNNIEYLLKRKAERGLKTPIIEVKAMEMDENRDELDKIVEYWRARGAWTTVRRLISWGGQHEGITHEKTDERYACGHAVGVCAITWDGDVVTCAMDADGRTVYGNINNQSIRKVWKERNEKMVCKHLEHKWDELPEVCKHCTDWTIVGEQRFDENGNAAKRNYDDKAMMQNSNN
ncbi:MAG: radical SAM protein [Clostridia bacterium]|nr:radical SAM protein [Clostridia bacterium]